MKSIAQIVIIATALFWIGMDIFLYTKFGNASTISATVWRYSWHIPGIPFAVGILIGHLFFQINGPTAFPDGKN
jgi:hypothetical protein